MAYLFDFEPIKKLMLRCAIFFSFYLVTIPAFGATYFVDGAVTEDNGTGAEASPKKYIKSGISLLRAGDTLIIRDGLYTGSSNMISSGTASPLNIASGTGTSNYVTIQGETYAGVIIDGEYTRPPCYIDSEAFVTFRNIHFRNSGQDFKANFWASNSHHIKVIQCASSDSANQHFRLRYSHHCLFEDCSAWGKGSYYFIFGGSYDDYTSCQYNIARRCVVRRDGHVTFSGGNNYGSFVSYWADHSYFQNCISIDGLDIDVESDGSDWHSSAALYTANGSSNFNAEGSLSVNDDGFAVLFESGASPTTVRNCAFFLSRNTNGPYKGGAYFRDGRQNIFENNIFADSAGYGLREGGSAVLQSARNNIIWNSVGAALSQISGSHTYNVLFSNGSNYFETSAGPGELTNIDPETSGLRYPVKIEDGSLLKQSGANNGQVGPTILNRVGVSGTIHGETGWNTTTSESLWPFPNEAAIRDRMREYNNNGIDGTRGFCASGQTLSRYIWEYLGHQCPDGMCEVNRGGDTNSSPVADASANAVSGNAPLEINFTGNGADSDGSIVSYSWDFGDGSTSTERSPSHLYISAGTYTARLYVTDDDGATDSDGLSITVNNASDDPTPGQMTTFYVRPDGGQYGNEDGSTYPNAWAGFSDINWDQIASNLPATLYVCGNFSSQLTVGRGGTSENQRVIIRGDFAQDPAWLDGGGSSPYAIYVEGHDYVSVVGFGDIRLFNRGIAFRTGADNGVVRDCSVTRISQYGIYAANCDNILIENNQATLCGTEVSDHGIYVCNSSDNPIVRKNLCYNGADIQFNGTTGDDWVISNALIEGNIIHGGKFMEIGSVQNSIIRNNLIYSADSKAMVLWDAGQGNQFGSKNNVIVNNTLHIAPNVNREGIQIRHGSTGNTIANNIIYTDNSVCLVIESDSTSGTNIYNNQYFNNNSSEIEWGGQYYSYSQFQSAMGLGQNDKEGDPHFVSIQDGNFSLRDENSPCVNAGSTLNAPEVDITGKNRPIGPLPDIGAYEYGRFAPLNLRFTNNL